MLRQKTKDTSDSRLNTLLKNYYSDNIKMAKASEKEIHGDTEAVVKSADGIQILTPDELKLKAARLKQM